MSKKGNPEEDEYGRYGMYNKLFENVEIVCPETKLIHRNGVSYEIEMSYCKNIRYYSHKIQLYPVYFSK